MQSSPWARNLPIALVAIGVIAACIPTGEESTSGMAMECAFPGATYDGVLQNSWSENSRIACETCEEIPPPEEFTQNLLVLKPDGKFTYTYTVFLEDNIDYAGSYEWSPETGNIIFHVASQPPGFDGEGTFHFTEDGRLILRDVWFSDELKSCGYEFLPWTH